MSEYYFCSKKVIDNFLGRINTLEFNYRENQKKEDVKPSDWPVYLAAVALAIEISVLVYLACKNPPESLELLILSLVIFNAIIQAFFDFYKGKSKAWLSAAFRAIPIMAGIAAFILQTQK